MSLRRTLSLRIFEKHKENLTIKDPKEVLITENPKEHSITEDSKKFLSLRPLRSFRNLNDVCAAKNSFWLFDVGIWYSER